MLKRLTATAIAIIALTVQASAEFLFGISERNEAAAVDVTDGSLWTARAEGSPANPDAYPLKYWRIRRWQRVTDGEGSYVYTNPQEWYFQAGTGTSPIGSMVASGGRAWVVGTAADGFFDTGDSTETSMLVVGCFKDDHIPKIRSFGAADNSRGMHITMAGPQGAVYAAGTQTNFGWYTGTDIVVWKLNPEGIGEWAGGYVGLDYGDDYPIGIQLSSDVFGTNVFVGAVCNTNQTGYGKFGMIKWSTTGLYNWANEWTYTTENGSSVKPADFHAVAPYVYMTATASGANMGTDWATVRLAQDTGAQAGAVHIVNGNNRRPGGPIPMTGSMDEPAFIRRVGNQTWVWGRSYNASQYGSVLTRAYSDTWTHVGDHWFKPNQSVYPIGIGGGGEVAVRTSTGQNPIYFRIDAMGQTKTVPDGSYGGTAFVGKRIEAHCNRSLGWGVWVAGPKVLGWDGP